MMGRSWPSHVKYSKKKWIFFDFLNINISFSPSEATLKLYTIIFSVVFPFDSFQLSFYIVKCFEKTPFRRLFYTIRSQELITLDCLKPFSTHSKMTWNTEKIYILRFTSRNFIFTRRFETVSMSTDAPKVGRKLWTNKILTDSNEISSTLQRKRRKHYPSLCIKFPQNEWECEFEIGMKQKLDWEWKIKVFLSSNDQHILCRYLAHIRAQNIFFSPPFPIHLVYAANLHVALVNCDALSWRFPFQFFFPSHVRNWNR